MNGLLMGVHNTPTLRCATVNGHVHINHQRSVSNTEGASIVASTCFTSDFSSSTSRCRSLIMRTRGSSFTTGLFVICCARDAYLGGPSTPATCAQ
jgi:hypothetical protein